MIERLLAADAALERDELDVAQRLFSQVADADPRNAIAVVGLARVAAHRDEPAAALILARRALDIDPDEAAARRLVMELEAPTAQAPVVPAADARPATPVSAAAAAPEAPSARPGWRRWLDRFLRRG